MAIKVIQNILDKLKVRKERIVLSKLLTSLLHNDSHTLHDLITKYGIDVNKLISSEDIMASCVVPGDSNWHTLQSRYSETEITAVIPLMIAARAGSYWCCQTLLSHGADVNIKEPKTSNTALLYALDGQGYKSCSKLLIDKGADVTRKDEYGSSVLNKLLARMTNTDCLIDESQSLLLEQVLSLGAKPDANDMAIVLHRLKLSLDKHTDELLYDRVKLFTTLREKGGNDVLVNDPSIFHKCDPTGELEQYVLALDKKNSAPALNKDVRINTNSDIDTEVDFK